MIAKPLLSWVLEQQCGLALLPFLFSLGFHLDVKPCNCVNLETQGFVFIHFQCFPILIEKLVLEVVWCHKTKLCSVRSVVG